MRCDDVLMLTEQRFATNGNDGTRPTATAFEYHDCLLERYHEGLHKDAVMMWTSTDQWYERKRRDPNK